MSTMAVDRALRGLPLGDEPALGAPAGAIEQLSWPDAGAAAVMSRAVDSRLRVLDAAVQCVSRFGVSKTTVEDVAQEARLGRATLYRLFPAGREEILNRMVSREIALLFTRLAARLSGIDDYEERIVVAMTGAAAELAAHGALAVVLEHEPEIVLPHVSFAELDSLLDVAASFFAPYLDGLLEPEDARRAGEWITRLVLSYTACPDGRSHPAGTADGGRTRPFAIHLEPLPEARVRAIVRNFVMPGIRAMGEPAARRHGPTTTASTVTR